MRDSQPDRPTVASSANGAGRRSVLGPLRESDRSHLLRRSSRFPFPQLLEEAELVRIRRERRVSASFSGIPPLSRNGRA